MPKSGGQGKGKPLLKDRNFGKALIKQRLKDEAHGPKERTNMSSILENSALEDYVNTQELGGMAPEVHRPVYGEAIIVEPVLTATTFQKYTSSDYDFEHLQIPRKPAWSTTMTAAEVDANERNDFLKWRRCIAELEEKSSHRVTPFEKNLEVWRQLWRVIERSDMAIQVVDARNPLLYFTSDLAAYASEHSPPRPMMLLVNKADYLTEYQRRAWARRFKEMGIKFVYYSAKQAQEIIDNEALAAMGSASRANKIASKTIKFNDPAAESEEDSEAGSDSEGESNGADVEAAAAIGYVKPAAKQSALTNDDVALLAQQLASSSTDSSSSSSGRSGDAALPRSGYAAYASVAETEAEQEAERRSSAVLTREQLLLLLSIIPGELGLSPQSRHASRICIGMLGYPNVGKSSVINSLLGVAKSSHDKIRVAVSSTPGKTKHFQTLMLNDQTMLCDCPGLVFPSFMRNVGEMLCAGILPINQMRDYVSAATVMSSRIPQHLLEAAYGMKIVRELDFKDNPDRPPNGHEMLAAYCAVKGYITNGTGRWDEFRACKEMLRDFNDGRILFVAPPFAEDAEDPLSVQAIEMWRKESESIMQRNARVAERLQQVAATTEAVAVDNDTAAASNRFEAGSMVFGDGNWDNEIDAGIDDIDDFSEEGEEATADGDAKREHKRLKHWGKKNRKLRDKDPYGDKNGPTSYAVFSTNRSRVGVFKSEAELAKRRQNPRATYGVEYTRPKFPHQLENASTLQGKLTSKSTSHA